MHDKTVESFFGLRRGRASAYLTGEDPHEEKRKKIAHYFSPYSTEADRRQIEAEVCCCSAGFVSLGCCIHGAHHG